MTKEHETYTEAETAARMEAALKRALATPHKPHTKKGGEPKPAPTKVQKGEG